MTSTPVSYYGLHSAEDLFFLHQGDGARCLTRGLGALESPFTVSRGYRLSCPHALPMAEAGVLPPDGLVRKLSPIPDGGAYWVPPEAREIIVSAQHLTCPTRNNVFVPWAYPIKRLAPELGITNLSPLIILRYAAKDIHPLMQLLELPRIRTVILCGPYRLPGTIAVDFTIPADGLSGPSILQAYVNEEVEKCRIGNFALTRSKTLGT